MTLLADNTQSQPEAYAAVSRWKLVNELGMNKARVEKGNTTRGAVLGWIRRRQRLFLRQLELAMRERDAHKILEAQQRITQLGQAAAQTQTLLADPSLGYKSETERVLLSNLTAIDEWMNEKAKHDVSGEARNEHGEWTASPTTPNQRYPWLPAGGLEEGPSKKVSPIVSSAKSYVIRQRLPDKHVTVTLKNGETRERDVPQFRYFDSATHKEIKDETKLAAYRKMIPPAGTHGLINPDPTAYHQSTWLNKDDRLQYTYVKGHEKSAAGEKYNRLKAFNKVLPKVRKQILADLDSDDPKIAQTALITYIIDKTGFRLGGETSERERGHYGASSLLSKHVKISGDKVEFNFIGKEGTEQHHIIHDQIMADHLARYKSSKWSQPLFEVSSTRVGKYVKDISGDDFSPKDFRTWNGTYQALKLIAKRKGPAKNESEFRKWQKEVAEKVGAKLGHSSPSMSLNNYIDPHVWTRWRTPEMGEWLPKKQRDDE